MVRDIPVDVDLRPSRRRASPTARGCARSSASSSCATRCAGWRRRSAVAEAGGARGPRRDGAARSRVARGRGAPTLATLARRPSSRSSRVAPETPEGELFPRERGVALRRLRGRRRGARRRGRGDPAELVAALGERPGRRARRQGARRRCRRNLALRHAGRRLPARAGAPRLPARRAVRGARARRRRPTTPPAARRRARARARRPRSASRSRERGLDGPAARRRAAARARAARDGDGGHQARHASGSAEIRTRVRDEVAALEREIWDLCRRGVHDRLAAAARRGAVREARPVAQAPRQDRLLDRRARAAGDPRRAPDRSRRSSAGAS